MKKYLDLTHEVHEGLPTYPSAWHPLVAVHQIGRINMERRRSYSVTLGTHTATHMDSPAHMIEDGITIDQIPLETIIGEALVLDFSDKGRGDKITLEEMQERGHNIVKGSRVLIKTGWHKNWGSNSFYDGWPWVTAEAAQWLVDQGIVLVAMDTPSPDNPKANTGYGQVSPIHNIFLQNGVILVEYLNNTLDITQETVRLILLPLKIKGADGFPIRAVAELNVSEGE